MPLLSIQNLTFACQTLAVLLAVPSLAGLGLACVLRATAAVSGQPAAAGITRHSDAMIILLGGITWLLGALAFVLAPIGRFASQALAVASGLGLALATAFVLTAHGLGVAAPWARPAAALLTALVFAVGLAATLVFRRKVRLAGVLTVAACLLAFHTLWVGYAA